MQLSTRHKLFLTLAMSGFCACSGLTPPAIDADEDAEMGVDMPEDMAPRPGDRCRVPSDCGDALLCAGNGSRFECMERCVQPGARCEGGEVCTALDVGGERDAICYRGGSVRRGESCSTNLECEAGNLCFGSGGERYCLEACHVTTPECSAPSSRCMLSEGSMSGHCQPIVGGRCEGRAQCGEELACSIDTGEAQRALRKVFPAAACTQVGCQSGASCGSEGRCVKLPYSGGDLDICVRECERDSACRFQVDERCWRASACEGREDEEACEAFLGERALCLPGAMNYVWD